MSEIVTIERSELFNLIAETSRNAAELAVNTTLQELGIKAPKESLWISQNKAHKMVGRGTLERAMREGRVKFKKTDIENPKGRVLVLRSDVIKLIKDPTS